MSEILQRPLCPYFFHPRLELNKVSCGSCEFCLWNFESVVLISVDRLCVLTVEGQFSNYLSIASTGSRDGKDFRVQFDSEGDLVVSTKSSRFLHVNRFYRPLWMPSSILEEWKWRSEIPHWYFEISVNVTIVFYLCYIYKCYLVW